MTDWLVCNQSAYFARSVGVNLKLDQVRGEGHKLEFPFEINRPVQSKADNSTARCEFRAASMEGWTSRGPLVLSQVAPDPGER